MKLKISVFVIVGLLFITCSPKLFKESWTKKQAPAVFKARFETTKGNFDIEAQRAWSPKAVDRLFQLIDSDFYTDIALFRIVPNFVVQFGIHNDTILNSSWSNYKIPDEKVIEKNVEGTISFARGGKETRTTQIFINIGNNSPRLDTLSYNGVNGFPVIAKVTNGMDVIQSFYNKYGGKPASRQDSIYKRGNTYLKKHYPKLDYIKKAYIVK